VPVRMAAAAPHERRQLVHLLITFWKPLKPTSTRWPDRCAPRARDRLPPATPNRPVGYRIEVGRKARLPRPTPPIPTTHILRPAIAGQVNPKQAIAEGSSFV
jgi:hypothetical protein